MSHPVVLGAYSCFYAQDGGPCKVLCIKPRLAIFKAKALPTVNSLQPLPQIILKYMFESAPLFAFDFSLYKLFIT